MERIHSLLQKIQEIYYKKGDKNIIDIDLMLDYTRVMYADLLEERNAVLAKGGMGFHLKNDTPQKQAESQQAPKQHEHTVIEGEAFVSDEEALDHPHLHESVDEVIDEVFPEEEELSSEIIEVESAESEADAVGHAEELILSEEQTNGDEEERVQRVINDDDFPSLNFDAIDVKVAPTEEPAVFSEINYEMPKVNDRASESQHETFVYQSRKKDIRSFIGINDKYQFMNELFANNKTNYEETLDEIVTKASAADAESWLLTELAPRNAWHLDDETVLELIAVVKKYFAA